jgi:hypothetical protein
MPQYLGIQRVAPTTNGRSALSTTVGGDLRRFQALRKRLAPAANALVGEHFDQRGRALPHPAL